MSRWYACWLVALGFVVAGTAAADPVHVVIPDDYAGTPVYVSLVNASRVGPDMRAIPEFTLYGGGFGVGGDLIVLDLPATVGECYRAIAFSGLGVSFASSRQICVTATGLVSSS